jgi:polysaccharide export outer membrane protein
MIARFLTASVFALGLPSLGYAQEAAPAPAEAAVTNASASASAPAAAPAPAAAAIVTDPRDYKIGPEDRLSISVWKNDDLSWVGPVRPDGKISLPLVHDIAVAGLSAAEVRAQVLERIGTFIKPAPEVSVSVLEVHSFKVSVLGRVRMPGQYEVKNGQARVTDMLARAQGFADFADIGSIRVVRYIDGKPTAIKFKYGDATRGVEGADFLVQPGDSIYVD